MTHSYYSPPGGTVAVTAYKPPLSEIVSTGEARSMVVACDQAKRVYGIVEGVPTWFRDFSNWPRAICMWKGLLFCSAGSLGNSIMVLDPVTGYVHRIMNVPNAPAGISGMSITEHAGQVWIILAFGMVGVGSVRGYTMSHLTLSEAWVNVFAATYPRYAELMGGWVFVCDTFGHKVYAVTLDNQMRDSVDIYYPNYVQMLASNIGLITAEHENRIVRWQYSPSVSFTLEMAAPVDPFDDPAKRKADIVAEENGTLDPASTFDPKKSLCATEAQPSGHTLYSPNSARRYGADLLVADTDNHRVIVEQAGVIVTEITGFNNPVTAVLM